MDNNARTARQHLHRLLKTEDSATELESMLDSMNPAELLHAVFQLTTDEQRALLSIVSADRAADLVGEMPDSHVADLIETMPTPQVASIVDEMASDQRVDILAELPQQDANAIVEQLEEEHALEVRELSSYAPDTAGGLMMKEYMAYPMTATVREALEDLTSKEGDYQFLTVHYIYVVVKMHKLKGVIRIRDLVFGDPEATLATLTKPALTVDTGADLGELEAFFNEYDIAAVPVVGDRNYLLGIVRRRAVLEALTEKSESDSLKVAGIIGGDELRSMPVLIRSRRRLAWLSINILLNIMAASVIALYEDTLTAVIALAVFLPIVSDMSGCSGNQAVAVSMRELTLGAAVPRDVLRVLGKEIAVGSINGLALGLLLGLAAWVWKGDVMLSLVVGAALSVNTLLAVSIGGTVPLVLKHLNVDPAVASGPLLTTLTDMCGFLLVLGLASIVLVQ